MNFISFKGSYRNCVGALAVSLLLGSLTATSALAGPTGSVVEVEGSAAAFQRAERRLLAAEAPVFREDIVATGERSRVELRLGGDTTVRLGASGRVKIERFSRATGVLTLGDGAVLVDKDPESKARTLEIESAYGRIAVRGTKFFAGPSKGTFGVFVQRGKVEVRAAGKKVVLTEGQGTDIAKPGAPPSPVKAWGAARIEEALDSVR